jgi:hypothetical protein
MYVIPRILVVVGVIAGGGCFAYWLERNTPNEKYRVRHPQAYSICCPKGWSGDVSYASENEVTDKAKRLDGLLLTPDVFTGIPPRLSVIRFANAPDPAAMEADSWKQGLFQGQPAYVREYKLPKNLFRGAFFERSGQWFEVIEFLSVPDSAQKDDWWPFLETFRYPDGPLPTTQPARVAPIAVPPSSQPFQFPAN